jgi:hypothetical protein
VETKNPSACATVECKVCKSAIALYCLYLNVIKSECVTEELINPIIRTRTRHFVTRTTLHVAEQSSKIFANCLQQPYYIKWNFNEMKRQPLPFSELRVFDTGPRMGVRHPQ